MVCRRRCWQEAVSGRVRWQVRQEGSAQRNPRELAVRSDEFLERVPEVYPLRGEVVLSWRGRRCLAVLTAAPSPGHLGGAASPARLGALESTGRSGTAGLGLDGESPGARVTTGLARAASTHAGKVGAERQRRGRHERGHLLSHHTLASKEDHIWQTTQRQRPDGTPRRRDPRARLHRPISSLQMMRSWQA